MSNIWQKAFPPSVPRYVPAGTTVNVTTIGFATASDPAGIRGALQHVSAWITGYNAYINLVLPEGVYTYTSPIVIGQLNSDRIKITGVSIGMAGVSSTPILDMVKNGTQDWDVKFQWTGGQTTGLAVGRVIKPRKNYDASDTTRMRELTGGHRVTAITTGSGGNVTVKMRPMEDLDTGLKLAAISFTDIRVIRTVIRCQFAFSAAHQGGFAFQSNIGFIDNCAVDMGRDALGAPSTGAYASTGTDDTAGFIVYAGAVARLGSNFCVLNSGKYGYENLGGRIDWLNGSICNVYGNAAYDQFGAHSNLARISVQGASVGAATNSGSTLHCPDSSWVGCTTAQQIQDGSVSTLLSQSYMGANTVVYQVDGGMISANGTELNGRGNVTNINFDHTGEIRYTEGGVDYYKIAP